MPIGHSKQSSRGSGPAKKSRFKGVFPGRWCTSYDQAQFIISRMEQKKRKNIFVEGAISPVFVAESLASHQSKTGIGGHSMFLGQVRADVVNGQQVEAIEYTSYQELALERMVEIREMIFAKYPLECMHVYHSLGRVPVGGICLFVFVSAAHRRPAMEACSELVERIKDSLPIWGKECFEQGDYQWKVNIV